MHVLDAAHKTVQSYPGGAEALATRMVVITQEGNERQMSASVLRSKVNANVRTHHLYLTEASEIMSLTADHRILHALAAEHGYVLQKADEVTAGASLLQVLLSANAAEGNFDSVLQEALSDGKITQNEMKAITEAGMRQTSTHMALLRLCQAISQHATGEG